MKAIDYIYSKPDYASEIALQLSRLNWNIDNQSVYIDLGTSVIYQEPENVHLPHFSFDLFATINSELNKLSFTFGQNLGQGLEIYFEFLYEGKNNVLEAFDIAHNECDDDIIKDIISKNTKEVDEIKSRLQSLINLLETDTTLIHSSKA
jgi:hypothetical protein